MTLDLSSSPFFRELKTLSWKGNGVWGDWDSECLLRLYQKDRKVIAICTDIGVGTSVTNCIEHIATLICEQYADRIYLNNFTLIEHYPEKPEIKKLESFSKVCLKFNWDKSKFESPAWENLSANTLRDAILQLPYPLELEDIYDEEDN